MAKSLSKVQKKVSKKRGNITSLHENSRDSQRLRRASARDDKISKVGAARARINQPYLKRVAYFQGAAKAADGPLTADQVKDLLESYVKRDSTELAELQDDRRPGRPSSSREDLLKQRMLTDEREYSSGFWLPDVMNAENIELLKAWTGAWTALSNLKFIRYRKDGVIHESTFPPKGQS